MPVPPGSGVTFAQVDWPNLPRPALNTGTGVLNVDLSQVRQSTGGESGYLNAATNDTWLVRNAPVFTEQAFPYPRFTTMFDLGVESGTEVPSIQVSVTFSPDPVFDPDNVRIQFSDYPVESVSLATGGLPDPNVTPPPSPAADAIPPYVTDNASAQVIQEGHPNVNAARNQCMPMAIANSLQYLENTTDLELDAPHEIGLAQNGTSDGSLVGEVEAETDRSGLSSRTAEEATGTWGLNGKLKFLAKNGLGDDIRTRHFGHSTGSPNGDFTSDPIVETDGGNSARSEPFGETVSIADMINSLRNGEDCEVVYTYPDGGAHAVELVAAGITGGLPWTVTASDLRQTDQGDASDSNLGPGDGFEYSEMSDVDGNGFLEFPDGRELVTAYCQKFVGEPPPTTTTTTHDVTIVNVEDPAGHECCVVPPPPQITVTREGQDIRFEGDGDGFPLEGMIDENGDFEAASSSPVAGFNNIDSVIEGTFQEDGSAQASLTIGDSGGLPTGQPIIYELDISPPLDAKSDGRADNRAKVSTFGDILEIAAGESLTIAAGQQMGFEGLLVNRGSLTVAAGATLVNKGLLDNRGTLLVEGTLEGGGLLNNRGEITNNGVIRSRGASSLSQSGSVQNNGNWEFIGGSRLVSSGSFTNDGIVAITGHAVNRGTFTGNGETEIPPQGQFDNFDELTGQITNAGRLINVCGAALDAIVDGIAARSMCRFEARASGFQQSPVVESSALGSATFQLDLAAPALEYRVALADLDLDDVIAVEIRRGDRFQNGDPVFTIMGAEGNDDDMVMVDTSNTLSGRWDTADTQPLTAELIDVLLDDRLYLQVRTQSHPDGEVRGQIVKRNDTRRTDADVESFLGLLYDRARDGHGLDLQRAGDQYFFTFYTHGEDRGPEWYQLVGTLANGVIRGDLRAFSYDENDVPPQTGRVVGEAELAVDVAPGSPGCDDSTDRTGATGLARFAWSIGQESGTWCLQPLIAGTTGPATDATGTWHAGASDDGWGISILQQGSVLAAVLYFYDDEGNPRWVLGTTHNFNSGDTLDMLQFTGYCRSCPFFRETAEAGTLTLTFAQPSQAFAGNTVTVDVAYLGPEGGEWVRDEVPIKLLSEPVP